jgi:hypothetical protein
MRRIALIASILVLAAACDKQDVTPKNATDGQAYTDLSSAPTILFQVFGPRETPRLAPIAVVRPTGLEPLVLSEEGWRVFDSTYFATGMQYPVYRNGVDAGTITVARGMWPADSGALYAIPGCRVVVPQAVATLQGNIPLEETVELLASTLPLVQPLDTRPVPPGAEEQGRTLASAVAAASEIGPEDLAALDFHARWLRTGVGANGRTLLTSYIDPNAGDRGPGTGNTAMLLVLAEDSAGTLNTSYRHAISGEARSVEFRRLVNYADLDGDSIAELVLEAWRYAGIPNLAVLTFTDGSWRESFRIGLDWCVDGR